MGIDTTDSESKQGLSFDQGHHLDLRGDTCLRQVAQETENFAATSELAERELADHPRVSQHLGFLEERGEPRTSNMLGRASRTLDLSYPRHRLWRQLPDACLTL